ncbi:unnamed protein product [Ceratitis capitata]|uniref:(Mediterranean fruit fly) hypothetical protein n=1 Tax=Ceratitis capitata TaxID=7213 RepID=A0A811V9R7_CERCA|nr:unnamed protein product [Ceratitis capitata]
MIYAPVALKPLFLTTALLLLLLSQLLAHSFRFPPLVKLNIAMFTAFMQNETAASLNARWQLGQCKTSLRCRQHWCNANDPWCDS